jgi:PEP-CTERM motif
MAIAAGGAGGGVFFGAEGGTATANSDSNAGATGNATSTAEATGGAGGDGFNLPGAGGAATSSSTATSSGVGNAWSSANANGGAGGAGVFAGGGDATASSNATSSLAGNATSIADANGGAGAGGFHPGFVVGGDNGGNGGDADAISTARSSGTGNASSSANSNGGAGGDVTSDFSSKGGDGVDATAMAIATAAGGGTAIANSVATGGAGGAAGVGSIPGAAGAANATSNAETAKGALAEAQSTAVGSSGNAQSTALTSYSFVKVQSAAVAQVGSTATTNAIAQGGAGQAFANPGQTAYAFSTVLPGKAYAATLIGGASHVASALLGPRDALFGTAILGANYASDGGGESSTTSASSTFDFGYGGDLQLGLIDDQVSGFANGLGFQSMEFTIQADGVEVLDVTFGSLAIAESFFRDDVIDLGADFGPNIDLTFGATLTADGPGGFGFDLAIGGAVPEPSTWAMMLVGFAGLGFAGHRSTQRRAAVRPRA